MSRDMMYIEDRPNATNWTLESGYQVAGSERTYPIRVFSSYHKAALSFNLRSFDTDVEFVCRTLVPGFRIYLHTPGEILQSDDISFRVPFSEEIRIAIKPRLTTTAEGLRSYDSKLRRCFFNSERQLRFFKYYSANNCRTECLANYTLEQCECVKFSMPSNFNKFTKIFNSN